MFLGTFAIFADDGSFTGYVTADVLNIRSGPSTDSDILGQLSYGDEVTILSTTDDGWGQISYNDSDAYVCMQYITARADDVSRGSDGSGQGAQVVAYAERFLGTPYKYGGESPSGFDCSGFVGYVYKNFGVSLPRVAASMASAGTAVDTSDWNNLQPGDILLFNSSVGGHYIGHCGIYVGNGVFIHSPQTGEVIKYTNLSDGSYGKRLAAARRIFNN